MKRENSQTPEQQVVDTELKKYGTSLLQIRSMTDNFRPGKMDQFNHHIEFLSPNGRWFMRMTRVGEVEEEVDRINIEIPTGWYHVVFKEKDCSKLIQEKQIESGDIIFEVYPYDPRVNEYWYKSVTAYGDDDNPSPPFQPYEKVYNLTKILKLSTPETYRKTSSI